jgi:hypothetical protein
LNEALDDRTTAYILETRRPFEDLRQVASQLAGLLVLAASGARSAAPDHPMLDAARELFGRAADEVRGARPPARAREHHRHLLLAVAGIDAALRAGSVYLRGDRSDRLDAVLEPLKAGYAQLQQAADRLPGFVLVAFDQCCWATGHAGHGGQVGRVGLAGQVGD